MDTRYKFRIIVIAFLAILSLTHCRSSCIGEVVNNVYSFKLGVNITPAKDTINIGDTLWINVNTSNRFRNLMGGDTVKFSGARNLGSAIGFQKLNTDNKFSISAANKFDFLLKRGTETKSADASLYKEFLFEEDNDSCVQEISATLTFSCKNTSLGVR
ncbi:MAG: hypothetical protein IE931_14585 [Sphingobacteriales bacterium]|nr:hypothetical protein [Sphingobacteriales bacterium]